MNYYARNERELSQLGIQEGELAIYVATVNSRQADSLSPGVPPKNAYVYFWKNDWPQEVDAEFRRDKAGLDILEAQIGGEEYTFLRDRPSGYIRQVSGPAKPIVVANLGAIPLRVDTFLGKFTVHAGTILRLDESAPQREKKKVLLTIGSWRDWPLESAELWDGLSWRRLNICEQYSSIGRELAVLDGSAVVQYITVEYYEDSDRYWLLMKDSPEPDPDYEIYITGKACSNVRLRFNRLEYRNGQSVQRVRTISFLRWGEPVIYDLQKLRESLTQSAATQCIAELPGRETVSVPEESAHPSSNDNSWAFLKGSDEPGGMVLEPGEADIEKEQEDCGGGDALSGLAELARIYREIRELPTPEPPGDFPE